MSNRRGAASGIILRVLVGAIVIIALFFFARSVQWGEVWRAMRASSLPILAAAAAVNLLSLVLKGVRWWVFMRPVGIPSLGLAIRGTFVGAGLNNILVANGGEAARVVYVSREANAPASTVLATLALERLFELIGWAFTLCIAVSVLDLPDTLRAARPAAAVGLVVMTGFLVYLLRAPSRKHEVEITGEGFLVRARRFGRQFVGSLREVSSGPRFVIALSISIVVWALQIATYHLTAVATGLPISVVATIACLLTVNLGFAVRATPGNVGVFQMVYAVTAAGFGADKDLATGTAFLIQIQQILPVTLLGLGFAPGLLRGRGNPTA